MAEFAQVNLNGLFGKVRLDAEFYREHYIENEGRLRSLPGTRTLGEVVTVFRKGIFDINAEEYQEEGIPFVRIGDLREWVIDDTDVVYISPERHAAEAKTALVRGDIILSKTARPAASLVQLEQCNASQDTIAVKTGRSQEYNVFLVAFLNTTPGRLQLQRLFQGNIQAHLSLEEARSVLVPYATDTLIEEVNRLFASSQECKRESRQRYSDAEDLLAQTIGVKSLKLPSAKSYTASFKDTIAADRLDAEHFKPQHSAVRDYLIQRFAGQPLALLGHVLKGKTPNEYVDEGVPVVRSGDLVDWDDTSNLLRADPAAIRFCLRQGDVLISSIGFGSIGKVQVFDHINQHTTVAEVTVLRQDRLNSHFLKAFLSSPLGQSQIESWITGATGQLHLRPSDVGKIIVPTSVPAGVQWKFEQLHREARALNRQAAAFLEEAKQHVEALVCGD